MGMPEKDNAAVPSEAPREGTAASEGAAVPDDAASCSMPQHERRTSSSLKVRCAVYISVVVLWLALDIATKQYFNTFQLGQTAGGPYFGIVQFRLVHNTGGAWGIFDDATVPLGVMSLLVCLVLSLYLFASQRDVSLCEALGISLVVAGGFGNAIDRFTLGYVVDFIEPVFIDFPTFNVADIGVTCGFVLFLAGMCWQMRKEQTQGDM